MSTPLGMTEILAFKPGLRVEQLDASTVFLLGEHERFLLRGRHIGVLAALVDGRRTVEDIVRNALSAMSEPEALYVLSRLAKDGHLVAADPSLAAARAAFWTELGLNATSAAASLRSSPVSVRSLTDSIPVS